MYTIKCQVKQYGDKQLWTTLYISYIVSCMVHVFLSEALGNCTWIISFSEESRYQWNCISIIQQTLSILPFTLRPCIALMIRWLLKTDKWFVTMQLICGILRLYLYREVVSMQAGSNVKISGTVRGRTILCVVVKEASISSNEKVS